MPVLVQAGERGRKWGGTQSLTGGCCSARRGTWVGVSRGRPWAPVSLGHVEKRLLCKGPTCLCGAQLFSPWEAAALCRRLPPPSPVLCRDQPTGCPVLGTGLFSVVGCRPRPAPRPGSAALLSWCHSSASVSPQHFSADRGQKRERNPGGLEVSWRTQALEECPGNLAVDQTPKQQGCEALSLT